MVLIRGIQIIHSSHCYPASVSTPQPRAALRSLDLQDPSTNPQPCSRLPGYWPAAGTFPEPVATHFQPHSLKAENLVPNHPLRSLPAAGTTSTSLAAPEGSHIEHTTREPTATGRELRRHPRPALNLFSCPLPGLSSFGPNRGARENEHGPCALNKAQPNNSGPLHP